MASGAGTLLVDADSPHIIYRIPITTTKEWIVDKPEESVQVTLDKAA